MTQQLPFNDKTLQAVSDQVLDTASKVIWQQAQATADKYGLKCITVVIAEDGAYRMDLPQGNKSSTVGVLTRALHKIMHHFDSED